MDKFHWLVLRALLVLLRQHSQHYVPGHPDQALVKEFENEIERAEKAGFEYYRESR